MDKLSWGVDGYGRKYICGHDNKILFCVLPGVSVYLAMDELRGYCECDYICKGEV